MDFLKNVLKICFYVAMRSFHGLNGFGREEKTDQARSPVPRRPRLFRGTAFCCGPVSEQIFGSSCEGSGRRHHRSRRKSLQRPCQEPFFPSREEMYGSKVGCTPCTNPGFCWCTKCALRKGLARRWREDKTACRSDDRSGTECSGNRTNHHRTLLSYNYLLLQSIAKLVKETTAGNICDQLPSH